jgi:hypothetical protein
MLQQNDRKITGIESRMLTGQTWKEAASVEKGTFGFTATGIYPFNPGTNLDHLFTSADSSQHNGSHSELWIHL